MKKQFKIQDLNKLYKDAEEMDKSIFAEQRSHLQLVAGEHYNRKNSRFWDRIRDTRDLTPEQKVRLTKNHIYKISKIRRNIILSHAAGVKIVANDETLIQDQKAAELNEKVWEFGKEQINFRQRVHEWAQEFYDIGEVAVKIYWDPRKGKLVGQKPPHEPDQFNVAPEEGTPQEDMQGIFSGDLNVEKIYGFNLLRHPSAKTMDESPVLIVRKTMYRNDVLDLVGDDEDKRKMIGEGKDDTYVVFDSTKNNYYREQGIVTLREFYYRPCPELPNGYFYITVEGGVLFEGELPFGIFPIIYQGHDSVPTTPRHRSPNKQLRPYQIEINRASSKVAEHQITLGDDKLVLQNGSKVSKGSDFPGVRTMSVTGQPPLVVQGRSGEQYFPYIEQQIQEMYSVAELQEALEDQPTGDAWAELYKSLRQKKKFAIDAEKFEFFLKSFCKLYLELAKKYFDANYLIQIVGKNEQANLPEFLTTKEQCYTIKVEPMTDDMETMMGKQLTFNHILQFAGTSLDQDQLGLVMRMSPFANSEQMAKELTLNYDRATNIILALDRGEAPTPNKYDKGEYIIKRLTARTLQADFQFLDPQIQQNYTNTISLYEQQEVEKQRTLKAAEADFIPTDGPMIKVAWYIKDPTNPDRSVQATLPANAINWLVQRLEDQGQNQQQLQSIQNTGALSEIAQKYTQGQGQQPMGQMGGAMPRLPMTPQAPQRGGLL